MAIKVTITGTDLDTDEKKQGAANMVARINHQRVRAGKPALENDTPAKAAASLATVFQERIAKQLDQAAANVGRVLPPGTIPRIQALDAAGKQAVLDAITAAEAAGGE